MSPAADSSPGYFLIMTRILPSLVAILLTALGGPLAGAQTLPSAESPEDRAARLAWWREARFGLFIHWGVYAVPAGCYEGRPIDWTAEWIMRRAKIPVATYQTFAQDFTAENYDPEAWAALAVEAGMKYMVVTSKHHDGFALFDSKASNWNAVQSSAARRDLIAPLAAAARKRGLRFGLYYSQAQDWTNPGGAKWEEPDLTGGWDESQRGRFDDYLSAVSLPQVRELLTKFQPDIFWWDTPTLMTPERAALFTPLLALRPGIITNDRLGGDVPGDLKTPEQHIPATGLDYDWEACMTMNDTWGFNRSDLNWKSTTTLLRNLADIASKGGNFLLNVGPTARGEIPEASIQRLREMGRWMKVNGESIYGTSASPFKKLPWGRCTQKTHDGVTTLYLHVFEWPSDGRLPIPGLKSEIGRATLLASGETLQVVSERSDVALVVPVEAPDPHVSVITLLLKGPALVETILPRPDADGNLTLGPKEADLHSTFGNVVQLAGPAHDPYIAHPGAESWIGWEFEVSGAGAYEVIAEMAAKEAGARYTAAWGKTKLEAEIPVSAGATTFLPVSFGRIEVASGGVHQISFHPVKQGWKAVQLRRVLLRPLP